MPSLTATGVGSGLDINSLLEQIVAAERTPTENRLNLKEAQIQAKLSAFGSMKSAVSTFQSALSKIKTPNGFLANSVTVSNTDVLSATASSIAEPGNYSVEVNTLAQSHVLASVAFDDLDSVIGNGTLTFRFGATDYDPGTSFEAGDDTYTSFTRNLDRNAQTVTIDNTNNTVEGVRDAINAANIGIRASIVNDGAGYRLLLTSTSQGQNNGLEISVNEGALPADNTDTTGLSQLAFNSSVTHMEQTQVAQDAQFKVNGMTITRETNSIGDAIRGVTLNLLSADPGKPLQIQIQRNDASVQENIEKFVETYNELASTYKSFTAWNPETSRGGVLTGDATSRNLMTQIRREIGAVFNSDSRFNSLSSIGITTNRDGTLTLDVDKLGESIDEDRDAVASLFHAMGETTGNGVSYQSLSSATQEGDYAVRISTAATQGGVSGVAVTVPVVIGSGNDSFSVVVNGVASGVLSLTHGSYNDADELAQEMQNRINAASALQRLGYGVTVVYNTDHFEIQSLRYGSGSRVTLGMTNADLGLTSAATLTRGVDVAGSIGKDPGVGAGQVLTGTGNASGLSLLIEGDQTGDRGMVSFSRGLAGKLDTLISKFLADDGQLTAKTDSLNSEIDEINTKREDLAKRLTVLEARYRSQFVAMDALVAQLQATGNYLQQQIDSLPEIKVK